MGTGSGVPGRRVILVALPYPQQDKAGPEARRDAAAVAVAPAGYEAVRESGRKGQAATSPSCAARPQVVGVAPDHLA